MKTPNVDVTLHIDENTSHDEREAFIESLYTLNGVDTASYRDEKPHLLLIKYNPNVIHSEEFIKEAQNRNLHAELIGL